MPKTVEKTLTFPLAGVARRRGYRKQERPYAAPWAVNVRGVGQLENRERGGSRPGLARVHSNNFGSVITCVKSVTSVDADTGTRYQDLVVIADGAISYLRGSSIGSPSPYLLWPDGSEILWDTGDNIIYDSTVSSVSAIGPTDAYDAVERNGRLLLADSVLRSYNPITGIVEVVGGTPPAAQPVIALYRDRVFLSGVDHQWYCSRQSDIEDWDFGGKEGDNGRAVAGQMSHSGIIGADLKAMIPFSDKNLVFACSNSLWVLNGDPATGSVTNVSPEIGILGTNAWARTPEGVMVFLGNDGLYLWNVGSGAPVRFSEERVPDELRNISPTENTITMAYDPVGRGVDLFVSPEITTITLSGDDLAPAGSVGVYTENGEYNDQPAYEHSSGSFWIWWSTATTQWIVSISKGSALVDNFYAIADYVGSTPIRSDWAATGGHYAGEPVTTAAVGAHWWIDLENKAVWPVVLRPEHEPLAVGRIETNGLAEVVFGCRDGRLRKFSSSDTDDDGTAIESHVLLGPFRISPSDTRDALLAEVHGIMADNSGAVTWRVMMGDSAEEVADKGVAGIVAALAGGSVVGVDATGIWADNRNKVVRPRSRGAWVVIWLSSATPWSYEAVAIRARQLGRLR